MTTREVYEASKGMPWEAKELWYDKLQERFTFDGVHDSNLQYTPSIPDSIAASAMLRAMVEYVAAHNGDCSFQHYETIEETLADLLEQCSGEYEWQQNRHKEQPNA